MCAFWVVNRLLQMSLGRTSQDAYGCIAHVPLGPFSFAPNLFWAAHCKMLIAVYYTVCATQCVAHVPLGRDVVDEMLEPNG